MKTEELIPLKRVLEELGVSRATLWRALNSGIESFPKPTIVRRRVHWKRNEISVIDHALDEYAGRNAFDKKRRHERAIPGERHRVLTELKKSQRRRRRRKSAPEAADGVQTDLFGQTGPNSDHPVGSR